LSHSLATIRNACGFFSQLDRPPMDDGSWRKPRGPRKVRNIARLPEAKDADTYSGLEKEHIGVLPALRMIRVFYVVVASTHQTTLVTSTRFRCQAETVGAVTAVMRRHGACPCAVQFIPIREIPKGKNV